MEAAGSPARAGTNLRSALPSGRAPATQNVLLLPFEFYQDELQALSSQIFRQVLFSRSPDRFPGPAAALFGFSIWRSEFDMEVGQANQHGGWVPMHHRLVVGVVGDPQCTDLIVVDLHFVVLGIDCNRVCASLASSLGVSSHRHSPLRDGKSLYAPSWHAPAGRYWTVVQSRLLRSARQESHHRASLSRHEPYVGPSRRTPSAPVPGRHRRRRSRPSSG